jgi:hypothetical protein
MRVMRSACSFRIVAMRRHFVGVAGALAEDARVRLQHLQWRADLAGEPTGSWPSVAGLSRAAAAIRARASRATRPPRRDGRARGGELRDHRLELARAPALLQAHEREEQPHRRPEQEQRGVVARSRACSMAPAATAVAVQSAASRR